MAFNSLEFLFVFLPAFLAVYYIAPPRLRSGVLLLSSLAFYGWGVRSAPWMLGLFLGLTAFSYLAALLMVWLPSAARGLLVITWTVLFGTLLTFKYMGLFTDAPLHLPLGISFYTFSLAAYLADVARGQTQAARNPLHLLNGIALYPKMISGPLMPWKDVSPQVRRPRCRMWRFDLGLREFVLGLGLKLLVADQIGGLWRQLGNIGYESVSAPLAWLGLIAYSLQLYFDFLGYSKMAVGIGAMAGLHLPDNFDHPYAARTMTDFWRRWHITLGAWFRDYVYIPLGGSRCSSGKHLRNLLVVWLFTGLWHGSTLNFLLWGLILFVLITVEKFWTGRFLERHGILSRIYMIPAILLTWMVFAITDLKQLGIFIGRLFSEYSWSAPDFQRYLHQYGWMLLLGIVLSTPFPARLWQRIRSSTLGTIILLVVFWAAVYCIAAGQNDPFMYFSF